MTTESAGSDEQTLDQVIEEALRDVRGLVSDKELAIMRQLLRERMEGPIAKRRLEAMKPGPVVEKSGIAVSGDDAQQPQHELRKRRPA